MPGRKPGAEFSELIKSMLGGRLSAPGFFLRIGAGVGCGPSGPPHLTKKAARLWAAAAALRIALGSLMSPGERRHFDQGLPQARSALGNEVFDVAWEEGCSMNWEQAVEYALDPAY